MPTTVDFQDLIAAHQARLGARGAGIWLIDNHIALLLRFEDDGSYSSIGLFDLETEVFILLGRDIDGVRVKRPEHGVYCRLLHPLYRKGIHIGAVEFLEYCILYLNEFPKLEIAGLGSGAQRQSQAQYCC